MIRGPSTPIRLGLGLFLLSLATTVAADAVHVVERGETLWGIARAHGVSVEALRTANELADADRVLAGQRLRVPSAAPDPAPVVPAAAAVPASADPPAAAVDADEEPLAEVAIEDASGRALDRLFDGLARLERDTPGALVRVAHFGDSHSATTSFSAAIRGALGARFGDAGVGFLQPGRPWPSYDPADVDLGTAGSWTFDRVHGRGETALDDGRFGLGGWSARSAEADAVLWVETEPRDAAGAFDVQYLAQPDGGSAELWLDGAAVGRIDTAADVATVRRHRVQAEDGTHRFEVRLRGDGEVRLLGLAAERPGPGVRWDVLATNGARADWLLEWDAALFAEALAQREPDLVVLLYGTNEVEDDDLDLDRYTERLAAALARVRDAVPGASCLVVGPPDLSHRERRRWLGTPEALPRLIEQQRTQAAAAGCAFFDLFAAMGGAGAMDRWAAAEPALGARDRVHLTARGYRRLGEALAGALVRAYDARTAEPSATAAAE